MSVRRNAPIEYEVNGSELVTAAPSTPGKPRTRSTSALANCLSRSSLYRDEGRRSSTVKTFSVLMPRSTLSTFAKLRSSNAAPIRSTKEMATCATTNP